jgi:hypothetical protein
MNHAGQLGRGGGWRSRDSYVSRQERESLPVPLALYVFGEAVSSSSAISSPFMTGRDFNSNSTARTRQRGRRGVRRGRSQILVLPAFDRAIAYPKTQRCHNALITWDGMGRGGAVVMH